MGFRTTELLFPVIATCKSGTAVKVAHRMAAMVYDDDDPTRPKDKPPRRYFGGYRPLADAIGRIHFDYPQTPEQVAANTLTHSAIDTAIRTLINAGVLQRMTRAINGHTAEYEVLPHISALAAEIEHGTTNF